MKLTLYKSQDELILKLNSLVVALLFASDIITTSISKMGILPNIQHNLIILILTSLFIFATVLKKKKIVIPIPTLVILVIVLIWYSYSILFFNKESDISPIQFVFYAILPIYAISQKLDGEYILRYILYFSLISVFVINSYFVIQYEQFDQAYLGNIYILLVPVISSIIHFYLYRKQSNIVIKLCYLYNLYLIVQMILYGNRGAVLCIIFCIVVMLINSYSDVSRKKLPAYKIIIIIVVGIIAIIMVMNTEVILKTLSDWCKSVFNSVPSFIPKMLKLIKQENVSDGRQHLSSYTINAFLNKPFFGHGIETFTYNTFTDIGKKWAFPHNYIYQYLFEGGIVFASIPIYLSISLAVKVILTRIKEKKEFALCSVLVCTCIPKLLFSSDPWNSPIIWMLITYSFVYIFKTNNFFISRSALHKHDA